MSSAISTNIFSIDLIEPSKGCTERFVRYLETTPMVEQKAHLYEYLKHKGLTAEGFRKDHPHVFCSLSTLHQKKLNDLLDLIGETEKVVSQMTWLENRAKCFENQNNRILDNIENKVCVEYAQLKVDLKGYIEKSKLYEKDAVHLRNQIICLKQEMGNLEKSALHEKIASLEGENTSLQNRVTHLTSENVQFLAHQVHTKKVLDMAYLVGVAIIILGIAVICFGNVAVGAALTLAGASSVMTAKAGGANDLMAASHEVSAKIGYWMCVQLVNGVTNICSIIVCGIRDRIVALFSREQKERAA